MSLSDLPPELIVQLPPLLEKQDVSRLSRACKRLRYIVLPVVYQTIRWRWDVPDQKTIQIHSAPIHLSLRNLMQKPMLGSYVAQIDFGGNKIRKQWMLYKVISPLWASENLPKLGKSDLQAALHFVHRFHLTPVGEWREGCN